MKSNNRLEHFNWAELYEINRQDNFVYGWGVMICDISESLEIQMKIYEITDQYVSEGWATGVFLQELGQYQQQPVFISVESTFKQAEQIAKRLINFIQDNFDMVAFQHVIQVDNHDIIVHHGVEWLSYFSDPKRYN